MKRSTFQSPYDQYKEHVGKEFSILSEIQPEDEEVGIQYNIKLSSKEEIVAWPEEVYDDQGWHP